MPFWSDWVGLPWQWGADPRDGKAACCFRSSQAVRESLGLCWPADRMHEWYQMAEHGLWNALRRDWGNRTVLLDKPEPGALIQFNQPDGSFGVGALVSKDAAVVVRHHGRLYVLPTMHWSNLPLYQLK